MLPSLFLALTFSAANANWPQYRGPNGDGTAAGKPPTTWSESENVRWKTPIHDKGWSSPVVWGNQAWVTTAKADGKEFFAICIDKSSGKIVYDISLFKEEKPAFCHAFNSYASPTPVIEEGRVYCHFGSHGTVCLDTATGKPVWENHELQCDHFRGPGSSPILYEDLLILTFDGFDLKYTAALNKNTGKVVWKTDHNIKYSTNNGDYHKAYGTPSVLTVNGQPQLVSPSAEATIAYEPRTGKELWRVATGGMNQAVKPLMAHDLIYLSGGHQQVLYAVKTGQNGVIPASGIAWKTLKEAPTRPSFLVVGDKLFMVNDKGIATCLNAKTGKLIWKDRLAGEFSASPILADGNIYVSDEFGKTYVFAAADEYKPVSINKLDTGCMASPAVVGDEIIIRTKTHLYCIAAK